MSEESSSGNDNNNLPEGNLRGDSADSSDISDGDERTGQQSAQNDLISVFQMLIRRFVMILTAVLFHF